MSTITHEQIINHRNHRKELGKGGCITGKPVPAINFFSTKDVQIWNKDANGRINGDPGFDKYNPGCFCFDCRSAFDKDALVDFELLQRGHPEAMKTYASLFTTLIPDSLPPRINVDLPMNPSLEDKEQMMMLSLHQLEGTIQSELILTMDKRQRAILCDINHDEYDDQEQKLFNLQDSIQQLRDCLDAYFKEVHKKI